MLPTLQASGAEVSEAWLAGIFGHAFTFSMARGAGEVWQTANIEWCFFFRELDLLPLRFTSFDAVLRGGRPAPSSEELRAMKEETWTNVVAGIDRGVPSIAWGAMTLEQKASGIPGFEWCLLVGYDARRRTYTVRHLPHERSWEVPFDGFGYCDPVNWYHVMSPAEKQSVNRPEAATRALDQALEYAQGKRFDPSAGCNPVDAIGFEAYGLWKEAFLRGQANPGASFGHAGFLRWARTQAAIFARELERADASEHYETEVEAVRRLEDVCRGAAGRGKFEPSEVWEAARHLDDALLAERNAIQRLSRGRG
ncbi:MAG TPA: hypothetical protein VJ921_06225 [Vicinamibacteria bacterium]|nr:hypothetical protein [Vicinamibacteria bacterium]